MPKDLQAVVAASQRGKAAPANGGFHAAGDNSNTQFAILGLWVARRHGVPTDPSLARCASVRFRNSQHGDGGWGYIPSGRSMRGLGSTPSMTCAGLLGFGPRLWRRQRSDPERNNAKLRAKSPAARSGQGRPVRDRHWRRWAPALAGLPTGRPAGNQGPVLQKGFYYLFSLERVAVAFNLKTIGNKDWYGWGSEILLNSQGPDGLWQGEHGASVDSCFALLFLRRVNLVKDLTAVLKGVPGPRRSDVERRRRRRRRAARSGFEVRHHAR